MAIQTGAVHHIALTVTETTRSREFYSAVLGFKHLMDLGPKVLLSNGPLVLALNPPTMPPSGHCAIPSFGGAPPTVLSPTMAASLSNACLLSLKPVACSADPFLPLCAWLCSPIGLTYLLLRSCLPILTLKTVSPYPAEHIPRRERW